MSRVHPLARTTPRTRAGIEDWPTSAAVPAERYNVTIATARASEGSGRIRRTLAPPAQAVHDAHANGLVERFNGRIADLVKQTRFASAAELDTTLQHYLSTLSSSSRFKQAGLDGAEPSGDGMRM